MVIVAKSAKIKLILAAVLVFFLLAVLLPASVLAQEYPASSGHADDVLPAGLLAGAFTDKTEISITENSFNIAIIPLIIYGAIYFLGLIFFLVMAIIMRQRIKKAAFIFCSVIWLLLGAFLVYQSLAATRESMDPILVENAAYETESYEPYQLSADQQAVVAEYGKPHGFVIMFTAQGRQETWFYYDQGLVLDFLGGLEIERSSDSSLADYGATRTSYAPDVFAYQMTPGTVLSVIEADSFLLNPLDEALLAEGDLYFCENIVLGFSEDGLHYVETLMSEVD